MKVISQIDYPDKSDFLDEDLTNRPNVHSLSVIESEIKGVKYKIPLMFIEFDSNANEYSKKENVDNYTLKLNDNNKYSLMSNQLNLDMTDGYLKFHNEFCDKYIEAKKKNKPSEVMEFNVRPHWIQRSETPYISFAKKYVFVTQIEMMLFSDDFCTFYIFFDPKTKQIRNIYQRT